MSLYNDLKAFYKFDGDLLDASGNGNHGSSVGTVTYPAGFNGQSVHVTGASAVIDIVDTPLGGSFSISARVKTTAQTSGGGYGGAVCESTSEGLFVHSSGKMSFYCAGADHFTVAPWAVGGWTHVLITYNPGNGTTGSLKIYMDGVLDSTFAVNISSGEFIAKTLYEVPGYPMDGDLDDVGLWARELTAAEAVTLAGTTYPFANPPPFALSEGLIRYYALNGDAVDAVSGINGAVTGPSPAWPAGHLSPLSLNCGASASNRFTAPTFGGGGPCSASFWIMIPTGIGLGTYGCVIGNMTSASVTSDWCLVGSNPRVLAYYTASNTNVPALNTDTGPAFDVWHHIVLTREVNAPPATGGTSNIYLDGVLVHTGQVSMTLGADTYLYIGGRPDAYTNTDACIQDVGLWNRALTASEVTDLYNGGAGLAYPFTGPAPTIVSTIPASGTTAGGTSVSITGTNFVNGATVTFGGVPATNVVFVNATSITCDTPAHAAGLVNVVVTNPDTQFATQVNGYEFIAPHITTLIVPSSGDVNGGTAVTILNSISHVSDKSDTFSGVALDVLKWSDTSASGTISVNNGLSLSVPISGGTARITSAWTASNADITFRFTNPRTNINVISSYTRCQISFVLPSVPPRLEYVCIKSYWDPVYGESASLSLCTGGIETSISIIRLSAPPQTLSIRRIGGLISAIVNNTYNMAYDGWSSAASTVEISAYSPAATLSVPHVITSSEFIVSPIVSIGGSLLSSTYELNGRIGGVTSSARLPTTLADIIVYGLSAAETIDMTYTYTADDGISIGQSNRIIIDNDTVLRG